MTPFAVHVRACHARRSRGETLAGADSSCTATTTGSPIDAETTRSMLGRSRVAPAPAGRVDTRLSDDAVGLIHQTSRGYPRAVNNLALQALVAGFGADKAIVDESSTRTAIAEVTAD